MSLRSLLWQVIIIYKKEGQSVRNVPNSSAQRGFKSAVYHTQNYKEYEFAMNKTLNGFTKISLFSVIA